MTGGVSTHLLVCFRYLSGSSFGMYCSGQSPVVSGSSSAFIPTPPPNLAQLLAHQQSQKTRRASPSSLPGRLNRALSLGTMPSLARQGQTVFCSCARFLSTDLYLNFRHLGIIPECTTNEMHIKAFLFVNGFTNK